jgi:hypothetical protein
MKWMWLCLYKEVNILYSAVSTIPFIIRETPCSTKLWTLNLPKLENPQGKSGLRDDQLMIDQSHFFITTPLNDYYDDDITFYNFIDNRIDANSRMCILQNGDKCYFNEDGYLTGYRSGLLYQYIRNENNQIVKIEVWKGRKVIGSINLNYDFKNRLSSIYCRKPATGKIYLWILMVCLNMS